MFFVGCLYSILWTSYNLCDLLSLVRPFFISSINGEIRLKPFIPYSLFLFSAITALKVADGVLEHASTRHSLGFPHCPPKMPSLPLSPILPFFPNSLPPPNHPINPSFKTPPFTNAMAPLFDLARLDPCNYDFNNINQVARMQMTIMEFMKLVRSNAFKTPEDRDLISKFCTFVNSDKVVEEWCNVETVVPEFRHALSDQ